MKSYGELRWGKPPPGYIPGLGRGAVGFCTRLDVGPARNIDAANNNFQIVKEQNENEQKDNKDYTNFNKFYGDDENLFGTTAVDEEDKEADEQYTFFDNYMDERRKAKKEKLEMDKLKKLRGKKPTIRQTFSELRNDLKRLNPVDWENIPEVKDFSTKKQKIKRYTPNTDIEIMSGVSNTLTPLNTNNTAGSSGIDNLSRAKNSILSTLFDKMSSNVSGQTSVNPLGYITEMSSLNPLPSTVAEGDVQDFKKARLLLQSLLSTNSKNASAWIASARLEELDGKIEQARKIINDGTKNITNSEDIWLEAARLHPPSEGEKILLKAVEYLPKSEKIWKRLIKLEKSYDSKKEKIKEALTNISTSESIWKMLIDLEVEKDNDESTLKEILSRAVQCVPHSIDFWLALAKLEKYEDAKKVLNNALKNNKSSALIIWVNAAMLEEAHSSDEKKVNGIVLNAMSSISEEGIKIGEDQWIDEALKAEKMNSLLTSKCIIRNLILSSKLSPKAVKKVFMEIVEKKKLKETSTESLKNIYLSLLELMKYSDIDLWMRFINMTQDPEHRVKALLFAIEKSPKDSQKEIFWLLYAKDKFKSGNTDEAISLMEKAFSSLKRENIIIALTKLYNSKGSFDASEKLLKEVIESDEKSKNNPRIYMYLIQLYRETSRVDDALKLCDEVMNKFNNKGYYKFYLIKPQLLLAQNNTEAAITTLLDALSLFKDCPFLYIELAKLYIQCKFLTKARAILEKGIAVNPANEVLNATLIAFEKKYGTAPTANRLLSKALEKLPTSGLILSLSIVLEKPSNRHAKALEAMKKNFNDPYIMTTIANLYFNEGDFSNARAFYEKALTANPDVGDTWVYYYISEQEARNRDEIFQRFVQQEPRHGVMWPSIKKEAENRNKKIEEVLVIASERMDIRKIFEINI